MVGIANIWFASVVEPILCVVRSGIGNRLLFSNGSFPDTFRWGGKAKREATGYVLFGVTVALYRKGISARFIGTHYVYGTYGPNGALLLGLSNLDY